MAYNAGMCGRFTLTTSKRELAELFGATEVETPAALPQYNIPPSAPALAVRQLPGHEGRQLLPLRWGLIPAWAKDPAIGNKLINARAESAADKPSFRDAFRRRRCLVLVDGFFEWKKQGGKRQPYYVRLRDPQPFAFAGLWERWRGPHDQPVETCTVLTTGANDLVRPIHDRMPVILEPAAYERWLDPGVNEPAELQPLLHPYRADQMIAYPVSRLVNNPRHDDAQCLEPLGEGGKRPTAEGQPALF
jgi:putative SOS response-associated peptidase YedK